MSEKEKLEQEVREDLEVVELDEEDLEDVAGGDINIFCPQREE